MMTWQFVLTSVMTNGKMIHFLQCMTPCSSSSKVSCTEDTSEYSDVDSESEENVDLPPKFQNLPEAIVCLENVHQFLELKGYTCEATETVTLTTLHSVNLSKAKRQTSLLEYFAETS